MAFKAILSGKGKIQLLMEDGWRYISNRKATGPNSTTYYTCVQKTCPARAATTGGPELDQLQLKYHAQLHKPHNHSPDKSENSAQEMLYNYREMARKNPDPPAKAVFEEIVAAKGAEGEDPATKEALDALGTFQSHRNMYYRIRTKRRPKLPTTIAEVDIESYGDLAKDLNGGPFYRGTTPSNAVLLMTTGGEEIAHRADSIFVDGTWKTCPKPYSMLFVMRAKVGETVHTIAYALMPDKKEKTYKEVLQKMQEICVAANKPLDFAFAHSDCERAIINAIKSVFPDTDIRLCHFHVADSVRRKVGSLGLKALLKTSQDFRTFYGRIQNIH